MSSQAGLLGGACCGCGVAETRTPDSGDRPCPVWSAGGEPALECKSQPILQSRDGDWVCRGHPTMCSMTIGMAIGVNVGVTAGVGFVAVDGSLARNACRRNTRVDGGGSVVGVRGSRRCA